MAYKELITAHKVHNSKDVKWVRGGNGYVSDDAFFVGLFDKKEHFIGKNEDEGGYGPVVLGKGLFPTSKSAVIIQQYEVLQIEEAKIHWSHTNFSTCTKLPRGAISYIPKYPKVFVGKHNTYGVVVVVKHKEWRRSETWTYVTHDGKESLDDFYILCQK